MSYQLATLGVDHPHLANASAARERFREAIDDLLDARGLAYERLWSYYANPMKLWVTEGETVGSERPYRLAQEWGLPPRITGYLSGSVPFEDSPVEAARKEVVIENDIGWRIDTTVDFLFGRPIVLDSAAPDETRARTIGALLRQIVVRNGGLGFLQRMSLLGAIYGTVDVVVKFDAAAVDHAAIEGGCSTALLGGEEEAGAADDVEVMKLARCIRFELVEPARALPILDPDDATNLLAFAQVFRSPRRPDDAPAGGATRRTDWLRGLLFPAEAKRADQVVVAEILGPDRWQRYRGERLMEEGTNPLGRVPVVHVQNTARPFRYEGGGDVEPLVPLQDRLNTHLSDRAHRVALQSMKMYLGVGITGFSDEPVQPGRMWSSDNLDARVEEFGGDGNSPSEEAAIRDIREALDKQSGVNPVAAGAIRNRVGNLTSAAALRLTFQSLLARTERKRASYGAAVERLCELSLAFLDATGSFANTPEERAIRITWPDPVPVGLSEQLEQAAIKQRIGIDPETVHRELGY